MAHIFFGICCLAAGAAIGVAVTILAAQSE